MQSSSSKYQEYDVRPGTVNRGFEYELKIATLFCLRSSLPNTKNMWLAMNADGCGAFDDIIMYRKTKNVENTFLIQLKHQEKESDIEQKEFTSKTKTNFYLVKYFESISKFEVAINTSTGKSTTLPEKSETETEDANAKIINLFQSDLDNVIYIIFTNRSIPAECNLLKKEIINNKTFAHINTGGKIYQFDYEKLNINPENDFEDYNKKVFFFSQQLHVNKLDVTIEKELERVIYPLKLTSPQISEVCQKFKNYIEEWSKGSIGGSYVITKTHILKVLTEILLTPYMVKIKALEEQSDYHQFTIWADLQRNYSTLFVDVTDFIKEFLQVYINTEVKNFVEDSKKTKMLLEYPDGIKRQLLKPVTNLNQNNFGALAYEYRWKTKELPLLIQVEDPQGLENVTNILKMSQNVFRVVILKSTTEILVRNIPEGSLVSLGDLNVKDQQIILGCPVRLQGGRSTIELSESLRDDLFKFVKVKEIIQISTGKFCIGNSLEPLPEFFILRSLECTYLHGEVLQKVTDDKFVIKCDSLGSFQKFLENHRLRIESSLIFSFKDTQTNFEMLNTPKIYLAPKEEHIKEFNKTNFSTNVHYLVLQNNNTLRWVKSVGTNKNIVPFLIKPDQFTVSNLEKTTFDAESQIPKLISASPGMGKSVLINYIAFNAPKNVWVLRINLSEHSEYYATEEFKNSHVDPSKHLFNFNNRILSKQKNVNDLTKKVFQKYLLSKKVLVLLDGFDETPIDYKDEVTKMIQSLNNFEYPLCITTRPVFKDHLEKLLGTFAISINPFSKNDQIHYLTEYFTKRNQTPESLAKKFVEKLLKVPNKNLSKRDEGFTGIPLQTNLLAQVYEEHCESYHNSNEFINDHFDLLYLYKSFIEKKSEIFCNRYGSNVCNVPYCSKKLRSFYALKLLFAKEDLSALNIDDYLEETNYSMPNLIRYFQKDGIIALVHGLNATFIHRTFAEYLAAEWLAENINGRYQDIAKILTKKIFHPTLTIVRNFFDHILAQDCTLHTAIINHQVDKATNIIKTNSEELSKTDKGGRTFLHLIAAWGVHHPVENKSEEEINNLIQTAIKDDMDKILKSVPTEKFNSTTRDTLLDYTSLDYSIVTGSLSVADSICAKLENLDRRIFSVAEDINYIKQYLKIFSYGSLGSVVIMHDIVKDLDSPLPLYENGDTGKTALHWAVIKGHQAKVKELLETHADINAIDNNKMTALHYALIVTLNNQPEILTLLLSKGANVAIADVNGKTALHYAVHYNQIENLKLLLLFGTSSGVLLHTDTDGCTVLHWAAEKGHTKILALLLNHGANVNVGDNNGHTPLHWASINDHIETVDFLIKNGAIIEVKDTVQKTPLILAAVDGRTNIIKLLLAKGADLRAKDIEGSNALHWAARNGHEETVRFLISEEGALLGTKDIEGLKALHWAARYGHTQIVNLLLSRNSNTAEINDQDTKGLTALHWAALSGHTETTKFLVSTKIGADIDAKDIHGATSLHWASTCGHTDIVELLLSHGANVHSEADEHETVLHWASAGGNIDVVALLLYKGANLEAKDKKYARTPLTRAVINDKIDTVRLLLTKGANIEATDIKRSTPLIWAAIQGHTAIAELLLTHGADTQAKDVYHMTALHWASHRGRTDIAVLLLPKEPDLEKVDKRKRTFLYCAALHGHVDTVKYFLSKGANPKARNIEGLTPLDIAVKKGYQEVVAVLQEK